MPDPARARRPRRPVAFLVAAFLVVLAEASVRWLAPSLPAPPVWPDRTTATKAAQLDRISGSGCVDVVFAGNSMTRDGLVPSVFEDADRDRRRAYNAALDAASPALLDRWLGEHVLPATRPATVVIGLASFDLNSEASTPAAALRAYEDAPFTATGAAASVEEWFTRRSALVRHRDALRQPDAVAGAVADRVRGVRADRADADGIDGILAADGHGLSRRQLRYAGEPAAIERLQRQFLEPFRIDGRQSAALSALIATIRNAGATPVVLLLPVTSDFVDAHPDGARDVARFRAAVDAAVGDAAAVIETTVPPTGFADTHHLNGDGADLLSRRLPALLDRAGVPRARCG